MTAMPGLRALLTDPLLQDVFCARREGVLLLDYDGTLAPFREERDKAVPYPGVTDILAGLPRTGSGRCIVVSGREPEEIAAFLGAAAPREIWGCHGASRLVADAEGIRASLTPAWEEALGRAVDSLADVVAPEAIERKSASLAVHFRGMPAGRATSLESFITPSWTILAQETGLELHRFDGGLELRPPGWDKGGAIRRVRLEHPDAVLLYCGDDRTDEDAFEALDASGIGVLVRPGPRQSAARYRLTPPEELLALLGAWAEAMRGGDVNQRSCHA